MSGFDLRIADFGYAERIIENISTDKDIRYNKSSSEMIFGTPSYIAPEALRGKGYTLKSDIYAVGSILFNLMTHKHLFPGQGDLEVLLANKAGDVSHVPFYLSNRMCRQYYSQNLVNFVMRLLEKNPSKRPTPREAL